MALRAADVSNGAGLLPPKAGALSARTLQVTPWQPSPQCGPKTPGARERAAGKEGTGAPGGGGDAGGRRGPRIRRKGDGPGTKPQAGQKGRAGTKGGAKTSAEDPPAPGAQRAAARGGGAGGSGGGPRREAAWNPPAKTIRGARAGRGRAGPGPNRKLWQRGVGRGPGGKRRGVWRKRKRGEGAARVGKRRRGGKGGPSRPRNSKKAQGKFLGGEFF